MQRLIAPSLPRSYVAMWGTLATIAIGYLTVSETYPELAAEWLPASYAHHETAQVDAMADHEAATEIEGLRRQLSALEQDRTSLRQELARRTDNEASLTQRLAALEQRQTAEATPESGVRLLSTIPAETSSAATPAKAAPRAAAAKTAEAAPKAPTSDPRKVAAAASKQAPAAAPAPNASATPAMSAVERLAERSQAELKAKATGAAIETGSVGNDAWRASPVSGSPAGQPAAPGRGTAAIHLGTGPSVDALRMTWGLVSERSRTSVSALEPRYTTRNAGAAGGQAYDLIAGPIANPEEAQRICSELKAQRISCGVTGFAGNAL